MDAGVVERGSGAAASLARELGLRVDDMAVLHNSNTLTLRLIPCDVVVRIAVMGQEVAAFEVSVARHLNARSAPIAPLDPRVEPRVHERDDFAITFWSYYDSIPGAASPGEYTDALRRLHAAMRSVDVGAPHVSTRIRAAERLVARPHETPELRDTDRSLLLDALAHGRQALSGCDAADQLLHGEPHSGNLLVTQQDGPLFIDLETCCLGPVEFDVAHAPVEVGALYPGVDQTVLQDCRRLVLAMVAAWRWDVADGFPDGRRHGLKILDLLRNGPPWPALGSLASE